MSLFALQKLRDVLDPIPDMQETLLLWGATFKIPVRAADDPVQLAIEAEIKANINKQEIGVITLHGAQEQQQHASSNIGSKTGSREHTGSKTGTTSGGEGSGGGDDALMLPTLGHLLPESTLPSLQQQQQLSSNDIDKNIADMVAKLKEKQDRRRTSNSSSSGNNTAPSTRGSASSSGIADSDGTPPLTSADGATSAARSAQQTASPSLKTEPIRDLAWFGGVHLDCNTILYKAPLQGWNTLSSSAEPPPSSANIDHRKR